MLPPALKLELEAALGHPPEAVERLRGGDINEAARFTIGHRALVVKWNRDPPQPPPGWPGMFEAEARGLAALAAARAVRVPACICHADEPAQGPPYIVLEWIEPASVSDYERSGALLGRLLAAQHRITSPAFGLDYHNYCGLTPQRNDQHECWPAFFAVERLGFQMQLAAERGRLPPDRQRRLGQLIERLDRWLPNDVPPSLLHGDLWGGNWLIAADNEPTILDPAVYFGDREAELAMCRLFGGFPESFYATYEEAWPLPPDWRDRLPIYQLYHLLNHLNLFGEGYAAQVDAVLRRYVG